jgi:DNA-binding protein Fis
MIESEQAIRFTEKLPTLKETEQLLINEALQRANGNQTIAARLLGLSRRALNNRLRRARE